MRDERTLNADTDGHRFETIDDDQLEMVTGGGVGNSVSKSATSGKRGNPRGGRPKSHP